jgi:hypothetical protein
MGTNKKGNKALALPQASNRDSAISTIGVAATDVLRKLAEVVSMENLTPGELATVFYTAATIEKILTDKKNGIKETARKKVIAYLKGNGTKGADSNVLTAIVGGWVLKMNPYRTGYNPELVAARIIAKEEKLEKYMVKQISYIMPDKDSEQMQKLRKLLGDELDKECKYEESWTVSSPTPLKEVEEEQS